MMGLSFGGLGKGKAFYAFSAWHAKHSEVATTLFKLYVFLWVWVADGGSELMEQDS